MSTASIVSNPATKTRPRNATQIAMMIAMPIAPYTRNATQLRMHARMLVSSASSGRRPRSTMSAGANQLAIAINAPARIATMPVTTPTSGWSTNICIGSAAMRARSSTLHRLRELKMTSMPMTAASTMIARLNTPTSSKGTKCWRLKPSNRCATRSGAPRASESQPTMIPPMKTGDSRDVAASPIRGMLPIRYVSTQ